MSLQLFHEILVLNAIEFKSFIVVGTNILHTFRLLTEIDNRTNIKTKSTKIKIMKGKKLNIKTEAEHHEDRGDLGPPKILKIFKDFFFFEIILNNFKKFKRTL